MNLFIYDDFLIKYKKALDNVEISLHNLGLNGKIIYLESVKNLNEVVSEEITSGVKTIIAVGNNHTLNVTLNAVLKVNLPNISDNIAIGIIPIGPNNSIALSCGIKDEKKAPSIALARRLKKVDVAVANGHHFISSAIIKSKGTILTIENFSIDPLKNGEIAIVNLPICSAKNHQVADPTDRKLDLHIDTDSKKPSFFPIKELKIENGQGEKLLLDNSIEIDLPAEVKIAEEKINLIVGKERCF